MPILTSPDIVIPENVKGLVFDCDGTIAHTMPLHYQAWLAALREHEADLPEAMFYEFAGMPTADFIRLLNDQNGYDMPVQATADYKEHLYLKMLPEVAPVEPVVELVHRFAGKLPMAVATGATRAICAKTLGSLGLLQHFQAIVTADDVEHPKPAPDIFLESARRIGVAASDCYAFEDGELGIRAATAAGMTVIDVRPAHRAALARRDGKS